MCGAAGELCRYCAANKDAGPSERLSGLISHGELTGDGYHLVESLPSLLKLSGFNPALGRWKDLGFKVILDK